MRTALHAGQDVEPILVEVQVERRHPDASLGLAFTMLDSATREAIDALPQEVYISCDVDGLDPGLCPNTGTPVPGGLSFAEACHLLLTLGESGRRVVGFDLVEVAPGAGEWDANVGARLLYKLCGVAARTRQSG